MAVHLQDVLRDSSLIANPPDNVLSTISDELATLTYLQKEIENEIRGIEYNGLSTYR